MFMPKSEKILVLGSNSFGGASYVNFALDRGFKVIGINRSLESHSCFYPYRKNKNKTSDF